MAALRACVHGHEAPGGRAEGAVHELFERERFGGGVQHREGGFVHFCIGLLVGLPCCVLLVGSVFQVHDCSVWLVDKLSIGGV